jgi:hypothetical protein
MHGIKGEFDAAIVGLLQHAGIQKRVYIAVNLTFRTPMPGQGGIFRAPIVLLLIRPWVAR